MVRRPNISRQTRTALASLLAKPFDWRHGYDISLETGLKAGTLYPILMRLHDQGFLEAEWQPSSKSGRPPRHAYRLTASGVALAMDTRPGSAVVSSLQPAAAT